MIALNVRPGGAGWSFFVACLCVGMQGAAQETAGLESLEKRLEALQAELQLERDSFGLELEAMGEELSKLRLRGQSSLAPNAFNPRITVFGNAVARADDRKVFLDDDVAEGRLDDRFHFRELEIDFRAAIDPYADGVVIASFEAELPGEFEAGIEEAYVELKRLPLLETAPWGLKLRAGRMRSEFGRFNQVHLHDLPQPSYPRALGTFLGPEGYVQEGLSARFFLPISGAGNALEANLQWLSGGELPVADDQGGSNLAGLGRIKYFSELNEASTLELGSSLWRSDSNHALMGFDASYKWKPLLQGESQSFLVGAELFKADVSAAALDSDSTGFYLWSQFQFNRSFYLGMRFDQSEELADSSLETRTLGLYGTYYTSEFLRMRLGYEHSTSDLALLDGRDSLLLELNFIIGSHPTEPYWVSR